MSWGWKIRIPASGNSGWAVELDINDSLNISDSKSESKLKVANVWPAPAQNFVTILQAVSIELGWHLYE